MIGCQILYNCRGQAMQAKRSLLKNVAYFRRILCAVCCGALLSFAGCGGHEPQESDDVISFPPAVSQSGGAPAASEAAKAGGVPPTSNASLGSTARLVQVASSVPRKIIYNATVD